MKKIKKRVAIYARVSTIDQDSAMQKRDLEAWCAINDHEIVEVFEETFTGTVSRRPQRDRLLASLDRFDIVLVWKLDRWGRSLVDLVSTTQNLQNQGIQFVALRDQLDLATPMGRFVFSILAGFAEFEVEIIRERVKAGMQNAKAQGKKFGAPRQFDYGIIQSLHREGPSYRSIASQVGCSVGTVQKALGKRK